MLQRGLPAIGDLFVFSVIIRHIRHYVPSTFWTN